MTEEKRTTWVIRSEEIIQQKVTFDKPVTKEEAIDMFWEEDWEDVTNIDSLEIQHAWINDNDQS